MGAFIGAVYRRLLLIRPAGASANVRVDKLRSAVLQAIDTRTEFHFIAQPPQARAQKLRRSLQLTCPSAFPSSYMDTIENPVELFREILRNLQKD